MPDVFTSFVGPLSWLSGTSRWASTPFYDQTASAKLDQRYYSPGTGRFLSADPYGGSANPKIPASWNRYAYTVGDPVNSVDPNGLCSCRWVEIAGGAPQLMCSGCGNAGGGIHRSPPKVEVDIGEPYSLPAPPPPRWAEKVFAGINLITSKKSWSQECESTLNTAGLGPRDLGNGLTLDAISQIQLAAPRTMFIDGTTSDVAYRDMYANAANPNLQNLVPNVTVADQFRNSGAGAMAELGGSRVFVRPEYFEYIGDGYAAAVIMHDLLHNLTGLTDPDLQRNLGLPDSGGSNNITLKLLQDCFAQ